MLNEKLAPAGFLAVLRSNVPEHIGNKCNGCDARKLCMNTKMQATHTCRSYETLGSEVYPPIIGRSDGCDVVYKRDGWDGVWVKNR